MSDDPGLLLRGNIVIGMWEFYFLFWGIPGRKEREQRLEPPEGKLVCSLHAVEACWTEWLKSQAY